MLHLRIRVSQCSNQYCSSGCSHGSLHAQDRVSGELLLPSVLGTLQGNLVGVSVSGQNAGGSLLHFQARSGVPDWLLEWCLWSRRDIVTCVVLLVGIIILRLQLKKKTFKAEFKNSVTASVLK